ncbi:MAG: carboxymuconolactone decarboxylase family protein [Deltaproteobacteria bacterium]|nr:carboxymuconolactone decarboxylase family protein [Deltaproteobacteria bacterium]
MPWIEVVSVSAATGLLRRIYDSALDRAGRVFHVVSLQSRQPQVLDASMRLYLRVMQAPREPLSRARREMIAVTVSRVNACGY